MFCQDCKKKATCKKICRPLENYLNRKEGKNGYSSRHIRRKEIPFSNNYIEDLVVKRLQRRMGKMS